MEIYLMFLWFIIQNELYFVVVRLRMGLIVRSFRRRLWARLKLIRPGETGSMNFII